MPRVTSVPVVARLTYERQGASRRLADAIRASELEVPLRVIGRNVCWCEQPSGHAWQGKDSGAPHPKVDTFARRPTLGRRWRKNG